MAHLTFWGKRKDVTVSIDDIMPISETNENIGSIYWKMSFYEDSSASKLLDRSELYITTRYIFRKNTIELKNSIIKQITLII